MSSHPVYDISRIKEIIQVEKQGVAVESHLLSLAGWIKENYGSTMNNAIKAVMPVKKEVKGQIKKDCLPSCREKGNGRYGRRV